jgi:hypothetical protein
VVASGKFIFNGMMVISAQTMCNPDRTKNYKGFDLITDFRTGSRKKVKSGGWVGVPKMLKGLIWSPVCDVRQRLATMVWRPDCPPSTAGGLTLPLPCGLVLVYTVILRMCS